MSWTAAQIYRGAVDTVRGGNPPVGQIRDKYPNRLIDESRRYEHQKWLHTQTTAAIPERYRAHHVLTMPGNRPRYGGPRKSYGSRTSTSTNASNRRRLTRRTRRTNKPRVARKLTRPGYRRRTHKRGGNAMTQTMNVLRSIQPILRYQYTEAATCPSGGNNPAVQGLQGYKFVYFNTQTELTNIFTSAGAAPGNYPGTGSTPGANTYNKIYFEKSHATIDFTNSSTGILHGCVYKIKPRRDIDVHPDVIINQDLPNVPLGGRGSYPTNTFANGLTATPTYQPLCQYPATPYMSPKFCQYFKIVKQWGIKLNPGESRQYTVKMRNGTFNNSLLVPPSSTAGPITEFRGWTFSLLFVFWGAPIHQAGSGQTAQASVAPTRMDFIVDKNWEYRGVPTLNARVYTNGPLTTLSTPLTYANTGVSVTPAAL